MEMMQKLRKFVINAYRIWISYDLPLIAHMAWNRLRYRHYLDYLKADWPCKFQFLRRHYGHILEKCRQNPVIHKPNDGPIWVCWWQGEEQMPEIVRLCYASLKRNAPSDRPIILLHAGNYCRYADIPKYIVEKFEMNVMSITHFTDILRMTLLAKHGGLWVDSTVFLSGKMPRDIFETTYFTCNTPYYPNSIAQSKYTVFLLGAAAGAPWIIFTREVLYAYWKTSWKLLDYVLVNYILTLALDSIPKLDEQIKTCVHNTPHITTIQELRNEVCKLSKYNKMLSECSFYKLSYKLDFREYNESGKLTYYGMLISSEKKLS